MGTWARPEEGQGQQAPSWLKAQRQAHLGDLGQPLDTTDSGRRRIDTSIKTGSKDCEHLSLSPRLLASQPRASILGHPIAQSGAIHLPVIYPLRGLPSWDPLIATVGDTDPWDGARRLSRPGITVTPWNHLPSPAGPHCGPFMDAVFNP